MNKLLLSLILSLFALITAQGQTSIQLKASKIKYIPGEKVEITVTITNNTAQTLNFTNKDNSPWLSIHVKDTADVDISQIGKLKPAPLSLKPGESRATKINIAQLYDLSIPGMYRASAAIKNPLDNKHYASDSRALVTIQNAYTLWKKEVGIPAGLPRAGRICRYSLQTMTDKSKGYVYVKLDDVETGQIIRAVCLGHYINFGKPTAKTDNTNKMHILYMCTSDTYCRITINAAGVISKQEYYKRLDSAASLVSAPDGSVHVKGGLLYNPFEKQDPIPDGSDIPL